MTVRQKPPGSGVWWVFISHQGRRKSKKVGSEDAARRLAEKVRERIALNLPPLERESAISPSFSEAARAWLADQERLVAQGKRSVTTLERGYRPIVERNLIPAFGGMTMESIERPEVVAYVERLAAKGMDGKTIRNHLTPLSRIFERLRNRGVRMENPVLGLRLEDLAITRANRPGDPFTMEELARLLQAVAKHYPSWLPHITTLALAGLRYSEMLGLQWQDIQFGEGSEDPNRYIMVQRAAIKVHSRWVVKGTKTGKKGEGRVDLHKDLRTILMAHQVEEMSSGRGHIDDWLFYGKQGGRDFRQKLVNDYRKAQHLAGLRVRTLKDLRHSFDTILLNELGEDIRYAQSQLRHTTIAMTADRYGHPDRLNDPMRLDRIDVLKGIV
ncbi:site-specific integrase [Nitrospinae bacterium AH_259_B05_G02_I21]|nr:site-specific integrase [Nitrospinae bacterium AH_259_B05_G02_I21]